MLECLALPSSGACAKRPLKVKTFLAVVLNLCWQIFVLSCGKEPGSKKDISVLEGTLERWCLHWRACSCLLLRACSYCAVIAGATVAGSAGVAAAAPLLDQLEFVCAADTREY